MADPPDPGAYVVADRELEELTPDDRRFFFKYLELGQLGLAYRKAFPKRKASIKSSQESGSRMMTRIRQKDGFQRMLTEAELGEERLLYELRERLTACTTKEYVVDEVSMYRGRRRTKKVIVEGEVHEDNGVRMRATELLARIHGKEVTKVEQEIRQVAAVIVLPAKATEEEWVRMVSGSERE